MSADKGYLGDGLYADFDGFAIVLTSEDGVRVLNRVVIEPEVWLELERWRSLLIARYSAPRAADVEPSP